MPQAKNSQLKPEPHSLISDTHSFLKTCVEKFWLDYPHLITGKCTDMEKQHIYRLNEKQVRT